MAELILPDSKDAETIVEDYFNWLVQRPISATERAQIFENCVPPIKMVIGAAEIANKGRLLEQEIFVVFIRDIASQFPNFSKFTDPLPGAAVGN
jgi:hypothetical protein